MSGTKRHRKWHKSPHNRFKAELIFSDHFSSEEEHKMMETEAKKKAKPTNNTIQHPRSQQQINYQNYGKQELNLKDNKSLPLVAKLKKSTQTPHQEKHKKQQLNLIGTLLLFMISCQFLNGSLSTILAFQVNNEETTTTLTTSGMTLTRGQNNDRFQNNTLATKVELKLKELRPPEATKEAAEEVELLPEPRNNNHRARKARKQALVDPNRPHIYKVRAAGQFNGRLTMPLRVQASDATSVIPGPPTSKDDEDLYNIRQPTTTTSHQKLKNRPEENRSSQFGARSSSNKSPTDKGLPPSEEMRPMTNQAVVRTSVSENCTTPTTMTLESNENQQAGNIAASSQTLRLFNKIPNKSQTTPLIASPPPLVPTNQNNNNNNLSQVRNTAKTSSGPEVDDSESSESRSTTTTYGFQSGESTLSRATARTPLQQEASGNSSSRASSSSSFSSSAQFQHQANNNQPEQTIPGTVSALPNEESVLASPTSNSESILTLIDEYDSKITTNRTKVMLHQFKSQSEPPQQVLNSLIERSKKQRQLLTLKPSENLNNPTTTTNESQWHWQHYHLPYQFGAKTPNFHDYDDPSTTLLPNNQTNSNQTTPTTIMVPPNYNHAAALTTTTNQNQLKNYDHLAQLSCDSGEMILRLNFSEPFKGIVYPNRDRLSPCRFFGDGHHNYELRLPLRGCGTRQAAPRFFVNDVIVRFHKTLELEEDEVKTLICRYPPPLAPIPTDTTFQNIPNLNRHNNNNLQDNLGFPSFELVDPVNGRPIANNNQNTRQPANVVLSAKIHNESGIPHFLSAGSNDSPDGSVLGSTSGNIETISENLVVAPSSEPNLNQARDPYGMSANGMTSLRNNSGNILGQQTQKNNNKPIGLITADLFNSRNSMITDSSSSASSPATFFERFSSIELLLMISTLMFLVLLAVGLVVGYYLFNRRNQTQRARRRAVAGLNGGGLPRQRASAILKQRTNQSNNTYRYPSPASLMAMRMNQQQVGPLPPPSHQRYHNQQTRMVNSTPSSPESDLSARGHLLACSTANNNDLQHQHHYGMFNRAYVPDLDQQQHYLMPGMAAASFGRAKPHMNNHFYPSGAVALAADQQQHSLNRLDHQNNYLKNNQLPVLGRREKAVYSGFQPANVNGFYAPLAPNRYYPQQQQQQLSSPLPVLSPARTGTSSSVLDSSKQLLPAHRDHQNLSRYSLVFDNNINKKRKLPTDQSSQLYRAEHIYVGPTNTIAHMNNNNNQMNNVNPTGGIWRAKSLSSVYHNNNGTDFMSSQMLNQQQDNNQLIGGTLMRHEQAAKGQLRRHLMNAKKHHYDYSNNNNSLKTETLANQHRNTNDSTSPSFQGEDSSDNDNMQNGGNAIGDHMDRRPPTTTKRRPGKLLLKSIEDSYITNLTEIYEQEYTKRDSTRQLSMSEWRQMQPNKNKNINNERDDNHNVIKTTGGSGFISDDKRRVNDIMQEGPNNRTSVISSGSDQERMEEQEDEEAYQRDKNNLRSLTELDVNFAKSSLLANENSLKRPPELRNDVLGNNLGPLNRSNSMPEVVKQQQQQVSSVLDLNSNQSDRNKRVRKRSYNQEELFKHNDDDDDDEFGLTSPESPDLILSPEYDHGQQHPLPQRLELIEPTGSISSHNSVSYV